MSKFGLTQKKIGKDKKKIVKLAKNCVFDKTMEVHAQIITTALITSKSHVFSKPHPKGKIPTPVTDLDTSFDDKSFRIQITTPCVGI